MKLREAETEFSGGDITGKAKIMVYILVYYM